MFDCQNFQVSIWNKTKMICKIFEYRVKVRKNKVIDRAILDLESLGFDNQPKSQM